MMRIGESPWAYRRSKTLRCSFRNGTICGHTLESPAGFPDGRRRCKDVSPNLSGKRTEHKEHDFLYCMESLYLFPAPEFRLCEPAFYF